MIICILKCILAWNKLGDESAELIGNVLSESKSIRSLKLANNGFTDVSCKSIAKALVMGSELTKLHLGIIRENL